MKRGVAIPWLILSATPWILSSQFHQSRSAGANVEPLILIIAILSLLIWSFLEASLLQFCLGAIRRVSSSLLRLLLTFGVSIITTLYIAIISISWICFFRYNAMPGPKDIGLIRFLWEPATISTYLKLGDILFVVGCSIAITFLLFLFARSALQEESPVWQNGKCGAAALVSLFILSSVLTPILGAEKLRDFANYLAAFTIPQGSYLAALFYPEQLKNYSIVPLNLAKREVPTPPPTSGPKPNILIIAVEALRADIVQEHLDELPTFKALASSGKLFTKFYAQASDTEYSLDTILYGTYPLRSSSRRYVPQHATNKRSIPGMLKELGYRTAYFTSFDWNRMRLDAERGDFDYYSDPTADGGTDTIERRVRETSHITGKVNPHAIITLLDRENGSRLVDWIEKDKAQPFFGLFYMYGSHYPYYAPSLDNSTLATDNTSYYFPKESAAYFRDRYITAVKDIDSVLGSILKQLADTGMDKNLMLFISGDHGEEFYEHSGCLHVGQLHEQVLHVPLFVKGLPQTCQADEAALLGHVDLAPTIYDLLALPAYPGHQGQSICVKSDPDRMLFATSQALTEEDAVYFRNYKFVRNYRGLAPRLFDLEKDSAEKFNLFDPNNELSQKLSSRLRLFRDQQISYYALPTETQAQFWPPTPFLSVGAK